MKHCISTKIGLVCVAMFIVGVTALSAAEETALKRSQWLRKIGPSATSYESLKETLTAIAPEDRIEFTQRTLKAVARMPVNSEEKGAAFVRTAVGCISGKLGDLKKSVIAEVFACIPVEYLPVVTEQLAKRFNQELNHLSDDQYNKIALETIEVAAKRNAKTDEPSVRNTFVILAFLRGTKNTELKKNLIALLPEERMRKLAEMWIPAVLEKQDYSALTSAANVDEEQVSSEAIYNAIGHTTLDRLLANLNVNQNEKDAREIASEQEDSSDNFDPKDIPITLSKTPPTIMSSGGINSPYVYSPSDVALNRTPSTYQNQGTSVLRRKR